MSKHTIKTVELPVTGQACWKCKNNILAVETPSGADYLTCPICGDGCACCNNPEYYDFEIDEHYCDTCNILFDTGCVHGENGCTYAVYYGILIKNYTYKNKIYNGMPVFDSFLSMIVLLPDLKLTRQCMCYISNCKSCKRACYLEETHSRYYKYNCFNKV